jgi:hypothetical protein
MKKRKKMLSEELISKIMLYNITDVAVMMKQIILLNKTHTDFYEWYFESIHHTTITHDSNLLYNPNCGICTYECCSTCEESYCICDAGYCSDCSFF